MPRPYLIFVDTNIFLDFYRYSSDKSLNLLDLLNANQEKIIRTYQVEMEYKKNRRNVIIEFYKKLSKLQPIQHPTFLATSKEAGFIEARISEINSRLDTLKARMEDVLANPTTKDHVYKKVQRLLTTDSPLNLNRRKDETLRRRIQHLARKRFSLGYPPRKNDDITIGDALNWEWIIHIARQESSNVAIVTRDSDYGFMHKGKPHISDWLRQEFQDRVSTQGKITYCNHISQALKLAGVNITQEAVKEEEEAAKSIEPAWQMPSVQYQTGRIFTSGLPGLSSYAHGVPLGRPPIQLSAGMSSLIDYASCPRCGDAMYSIGNAPRRCRRCDGPFPQELRETR